MAESIDWNDGYGAEDEPQRPRGGLWRRLWRTRSTTVAPDATCRPVSVLGADGEPVHATVLGDAPMSDESRAAFGEIVRATQRRFADSHSPWSQWLTDQLLDHEWTSSGLVEASGHVFDLKQVSRWLHSQDVPEPWAAVLVAKAFGASVAEALRAAEHGVLVDAILEEIGPLHDEYGIRADWISTRSSEGPVAETLDDAIEALSEFDAKHGGRVVSRTLIQRPVGAWREIGDDRG